ncbi:hypothetical protein RO3G_10040 [Rhizopus delemar RA 99-880]|uniref:Uncharacterized protein n=1 Tax=Rhizopus delemar (strain RA 99-880 / ATCC MYA-4621 / FGSC 9543 / NRRL 43880) TaxID=246409 RepID=I1CA50_RHIO9|nr:hypothetical protein RO3G_10040 [Rhizopus delemar RA 99-880]|eukprot:EIE85330.1 hypothetical protein RO3G_10040 [Rhizopus delemar RA 99-880]
MKSDEWRTWVVALSPFLLKQRLSGEHFVNWLRYVDAVKLVTGPSITVEDIDTAHLLMKNFGKTCVELYGESMPTPNMHMHLHLKESFLDFGPSYSFWLYGFERLNGDMKDININFKTGFETTYATMFIQNVHTQDLVYSLHSFINSTNEDMLLLTKFIEEIGEVTNDESGLTPFDYSRFIDGPSLFNSTITGSEPLPPTSYPLKFNKKTELICHEHYDALKNYYMNTYAPMTTNTYIDTTIHSFKKITLLGQLYQPASDNSLSSSPSSFIQAIVDN